MSFALRPVTRADLPRVAAYLTARSPGEPGDRLERRLEWRLFENPAARPQVDAGHLLEGSRGEVAGISLAVPQRFTDGARERLGLCSSAMYVDEGARLQGFLLFRRFLSQPYVDFWFATTCNALSAALWQRGGGRADPESRHELVLPLHRLLGLVRRSSVTLAPTSDWDRLAALAARQQPNRLLARRDAGYLAWRYGGGPDAPDRRVWLVRDHAGTEGWAAAGRITRAFAPRRRSWLLLDLIWPHPDLTGIVVALARALDRDGDLLALRGEHAKAVRTWLPIGLRREFPQSPIWSLPAGVTPGFVPADGDTAP
ncbi:MAG: hypothetical protein AB7P99_15635 [Vicinamibacterales bacterium]